MFVFPREGNAWEIGHRACVWLNGLAGNALKNLGMPYDVGVLRWPRGILLPSTILHLRTNPRGGQGRARDISHEAIPHGLHLSFVVMLRELEGEDRLPVPSINEISKIFENIGQYEGISPYGSEEGWGLFDVKSVDTVGRDDPGPG